MVKDHLVCFLTRAQKVGILQGSSLEGKNTESQLTFSINATYCNIIFVSCDTCVAVTSRFPPLKHQ